MIPHVERPCTLLIEGWQKGFNKVGFTKMLQEEFDLSLTIAKGMTDQILENKPLAINVAEIDIERVSLRARNLGAIVRRGSFVAEDSCR